MVVAPALKNVIRCSLSTEMIASAEISTTPANRASAMDRARSSFAT